MRARQTGVHIIKASSAGKVVTTELRLEEGNWPSEPAAPATMWADETDPSRKVTKLHLLVRLDGEMADGIFLDRFDDSGAEAGHTRHQSVEDPQAQAVPEYGENLGPWVIVPSDQDDPLVFALRLDAS
jgi:hypothetical protein